MVEQTKWDKTKAKLSWVSSRLDEGPDVEHKPLEKIRCFLNYVMQVYPAMIPYLRGFHGTLDSWRSNRTADGFDKRVNPELELEAVAKQPRLKRQKTLFHSSDQADQDAEPEETGFDGADASGKGFGAALKLWNGIVFYRQGSIWEYRITDIQSSKYRELRKFG
jgi:hypothetical protein